MVKDGKQHIKSLSDGRAMYLDGKLIKNHVNHPAYAESIKSVGRLYDFQADPKNLDLMTFESPKTGKRVSRSYLRACQSLFNAERHWRPGLNYPAAIWVDPQIT